MARRNPSFLRSRRAAHPCGPPPNGRRQYANDCFFTVCNYEQVLRDILAIEGVAWDLIILDEGQRIKNWESKTSRVIKSLRSRFALVLTGTPLENRLDDLFSIAQFVDDRRLGPGFRFFNKHRVVDEKGKVLGYKNLGELRETLKPILLRGTRDSVRLELPQRTTEFVRIAPERRTILDPPLPYANRGQSCQEIHQRNGLAAAAKRAAHVPDVGEQHVPGRKAAARLFDEAGKLDELLESLFEEEGRKVVLFSEWTTMLDLIEPLCARESSTMFAWTAACRKRSDRS